MSFVCALFLAHVAIAAGEERSPLVHVLESPLVLAVGLVSYSLFLLQFLSCSGSVSTGSPETVPTCRSQRSRPVGGPRATAKLAAWLRLVAAAPGALLQQPTQGPG
jgi:peptidoglycan/LPS O-acetylase OafA/YrhL